MQKYRLSNPGEKHGLVEEHLQPYLAEGWSIQSICGLGGADGINVRGWVAVVLEKKGPA